MSEENKMSVDNPTVEEKEAIQRFYLSTRELLAKGFIPAWAIQKSFEEAMGGYQNEIVWRPTHVSPAAIDEAVNGTFTNLQRAHGVVDDRLDRYTRTIEVLTGEEKPFDSWWPFWQKHDVTVLITKDEHNSGKHFQFKDLVEIPQDNGVMFGRAGFSFKFRKKVELEWMKSLLAEGKIRRDSDGKYCIVNS